MKVIHLSAECYPVAKIGGLGDVAGALPKYLNQLGVEAVVVMPFYERKFVQENEFDTIFRANTYLGDRKQPGTLAAAQYDANYIGTHNLGFKLW